MLWQSDVAAKTRLGVAVSFQFSLLLKFDRSNYFLDVWIPETVRMFFDVCRSVAGRFLCTQGVESFSRPQIGLRCAGGAGVVPGI